MNILVSHSQNHSGYILGSQGKAKGKDGGQGEGVEARGSVEVGVEMRTGRGWSSGKGQRLGGRWRPGK